VPVYPETLALCRALGLAPWGLIASGALLLAVESDDAPAIVHALEAAGIRAAVIGRVTAPERGVKLRRQGALRDNIRRLPHFERDEIAQLFE
jgi:hydrogenase maturation factor